MKAGVRALNRDPSSLAETKTQRGPVVPALLNRANARRLKSVISFAGGEEERYFAPITTRRAAALPGTRVPGTGA